MKEIKDVFYVGCELETGDIYYFTFTYEKGGALRKVDKQLLQCNSLPDI